MAVAMPGYAGYTMAKCIRQTKPVYQFFGFRASIHRHRFNRNDENEEEEKKDKNNNNILK